MMSCCSGTRSVNVASVVAGAVCAIVLLAGSPASGQSVEDSTDAVRLPIQAHNADPSIALGWEPGVFSWTFDAAGWPNGVSALGQDPNRIALNWNGQAMDDLLTGRPRFDMIPLALLASQRWDGFGSVEMANDSLSMPDPVTRVRYESAGDGLQAVHALHVQNRYRRTSDSTGYRLQTVFGYAGAGAEGEYDGSELRRGRQITARIALEGDQWGLWIQDVASRRAVGAHAGVLPFTGATYESIYQRLGATVSDPTARRRTVRNDLEIGGRLERRGWQGRLRTLRSSQTLDFRGSSIDRRAWTTRWQLKADASRILRPGTVTLSANFLRDGNFGGDAWTTTPSNRQQFGAGIDLMSPLGYSVAVGAKDGTANSWWFARIEGQRALGPVNVRGSLLRDAHRISLLEWTGFGEDIPGVSDLGDLPLQEQRMARLAVNTSTGPVIWDLEASHLQEMDAIIHQLTANLGELASSEMTGNRSRSTVTASLRWRDDGRRGLYLRLSGSVQSSKAPTSAAGALWEGSMPDSWASGRLGWRALLFQSDLDLDLYIRGRTWGSMNGLRLHTPTGLLVLPEDASSQVSESAAVDIGAEGDVRGATFFFAYENIFSGTTVQIGNLLVPDYPFPRQRIRFGVYWPIAN